MFLKTLLPLLTLIFQPAFGAWAVTQYVIVRNITTGLIPDYVESSTVFPTASVSPISTSTTVAHEYLYPTQNGNGVATISVTTSYLMLPTEPADLPVVTESPTPTETHSIKTNYYIPVTVSNPESCTMTDFTYTDTIGISLSSALASGATDTRLALFVTTYESTISTNLGGQPVTTAVCDVYFKSNAFPVDDFRVEDDHLLSECVDPRRHVCTELGQNSAATGSGGCDGPYPPTAGSNQATPTDYDSAAQPTETGGAGSWRRQSEWWELIVLPSFTAVLLLTN
ncbi:hypothetical protein N7532_001977 [Penicillium argentinense]|uniref:Uncharacterized protein n=1 Tax=Penicillium argentinense TaxID=1131581 RepID=A0A9W9G535_9EURO|nr:uncharacterized protein N7532_001977 [Penicillium argentinense]KAJ5111442.1 hypothetical protein N7532_001977 [Penicillium argentinense]